METTAPLLPMQVWDWLLRWVPSFLMGVGLIALWMLWKRGKIFTLGEKHGEKVRRDDALMGRLLDIQAEQAKSINNLAEAIRGQSRETCAEMREMATTLMQGLRDIHGRIDVALTERHKSVHAAKGA